MANGNPDPGIERPIPPDYQNPDPRIDRPVPPGYRNPDPGIDRTGYMQLVDPNAPPDPRRVLMDLFRQRLPQFQQGRQPFPMMPPNAAADSRWGDETGPVEQPPAAPEYQPRLPYRTPWRAPFDLPRPRDSSQWGGEWWATAGAKNYPGNILSPSLPSPTEAMGIFNRGGQSLQQWGSRGVGMYAGQMSQMAQRLAPYLDMLSKGAFSKNFLAARLGSLKAMEAEMQINAEMGVEKHKKELLETGKIFTLWKSGMYGDGAAGDERAKQELENWALENDHKNLYNIIVNKGMGAAENWLKWEDQQMLAIEAAWTSSKKSSETGKSELTTDTLGGEIGGTDVTKTAPTAEPKIAGAEPTPPGAKAPETPDIAATNAEISKAHMLTPAGLDAARSLLHGDSKTSDYHGDLGQKHVVDGANDFRAKIDRIATGPGTPQQKIDAIRGVDPATADNVESIGSYRGDIQSIQAGGGYRGQIEGWTKSVYRGKYDRNNFKAAQRFVDPASQTQREIQRIGLIAQAYTQVNEASKDLNENSSPPKNAIDRFIATNTTGDPKWDKMYSAIRTYVMQTVSAQSLTGVTRQGLVDGMMKYISPTSSPRSIRVSLQVEGRDVAAALSNLESDWHRIRPGDALPGITKESYDGLSAVVRANAYTGQIPDDAPLPMRNASKDPSKAYTRLTDEQKRPTVTLKDYSGARKFIAANKDSLDPAIKAQVQANMLLLGTQLNMPGAPDEDGQ
jgi:hypothetical protein